MVLNYFAPKVEDPDFVYDIEIPDDSDPCNLDSNCNPDHPICVDSDDVIRAYNRIKGGILNTPCYPSKLSDDLNMKLFFKKDYLQFTSSFKERGVRNILIQLKEENGLMNGVITASAGNHALGMCYHGSLLNIPVTVVMPKTAPLIKINNCIKFGSRVIINGESLTEAKRYAMKLAEINKLVYVNGYDHPSIISGQGTIAVEIAQEIPDLDVMIVQVGGGGLLGGICAYFSRLKKRPRIIAVESKRSNSWITSYQEGKAVSIKAKTTIADGLNVERVGVNSLATAMSYGVECLAIDEKYLSQAIINLLETEKCVVEGAGAAGLAGILSGNIQGLEEKKVCVILSGGNIDTTVLCKVIERGLAFEGRLHRFDVIVPDNPGSVAKVTKLLESLNASIKDILHERAWLFSEMSSVRVRFIIETIDKEHGNQVKKVIKENYPNSVW